MIIRNLRSGRRLAVLAVFAIVAVSAFGFAASNIMPTDTKAGDGTSPITGYTVSSVSYTLDTTNPATITGVSFSLDAAASTVAVTIGQDTDPAQSSTCSNTGAFNWSCASFTTAPSVELADELRVVAAQ